MYVNTRTAVRELGLHPNTLRKYANAGIIPTIRTEGGRRLYDIAAYLRKAADRATVCYCRVSSRKQRDDLARQVNKMRETYSQAEIIEDIGSGLNFNRKGLKALLERILRGEKLEIVVAHRDRLARFGFKLIEQIVEFNGGKIVVLDSGVSKTPEGELTEDLLAILHHFSCRMHGSRSHKNKENQDLSQFDTEKDVSGMVRDFSLRIQQSVGIATEEISTLDGYCQGNTE